MKSYNGNIGLINKNSAPAIFSKLEEYQVPYHEIYFGKPYADFYIDDLAVNSFDNIEKNIGFYFSKIETRQQNTAEIDKNIFIKKTHNIGEIYWYSSIPRAILHLFPKCHKIKKETLFLEKIEGISFDYLNVNKMLTKKHLQNLFNEIDAIHTTSKKINHCLNIYLNYYNKIIKRMNNIYIFKIKDTLKFKQNLEFLIDYEKKQLGKCGIIHGDPVFTNIFFQPNNNKIKFIDMRGMLGDIQTIFGDIFYDYAKIYQSLIGYDFIYNDKVFDKPYIQENIKIFNELFLEKYNRQQLENVRKITVSFLYSMLPFHNNENKIKKYIQLAKEI
jgi:hypothetical protein